MPKLPVPNFSKREYWLAGLLVGIYGQGSEDFTLRSARGDGGGDFVSCLGCERLRSEELLDALDFFRRREPGGMLRREGDSTLRAGGAQGWESGKATRTTEDVRTGSLAYGRTV